MKLEVGMYVRLNCNYELGIGKTIRETDEDNFIKTKFKDDFECSLPTYMITKASHNIIDLIEVGDYVNGKEIAYIDEFGKYIAICETDITTRDFEGRYEFKKIKEEEIKSIVTKEQFEAMKYEIK